jgi:hypothetical protein
MAMVGLITVFLIRVSVYLFTQGPVLLWEVIAGLFTGRITLRLLSRVADHVFAGSDRFPVRR